MQVVGSLEALLNSWTRRRTEWTLGLNCRRLCYRWGFEWVEI